ncbi:MAG: hypothetical protein KME18_16665 [Phormidium tanganyikae FI6-MK23]|jgi:hypothetical protein|nr:hypothetical protein [Phormidium tanganyikae FI6-MK23]
MSSENSWAAIHQKAIAYYKAKQVREQVFSELEALAQKHPIVSSREVLRLIALVKSNDSQAS